ncbi:hypothetical protein BK026_16345 [Alteromonas sp. V450]|uniref:hypothetical protein n=1 Tax=Alteromonas sp. V450 TaxID=1912139 RepID=UPI0008FF0547|nr:hypothetical protein [Alteromonas sp. V450]OJF70217.1 hypothetical protein BK026_16345 [Alteromonas sp. V450]
MKVIPLLAVIVAVITGSFAISSHSESRSSVCEFQPVAEFNPKLPASHIQNQCARYHDGVTEVSWFSWFAGKSSSFQFHFLDLLELLHNDEGNRDFGTSPNDA